jgi:hypothetical protein
MAPMRGRILSRRFDTALEARCSTQRRRVVDLIYCPARDCESEPHLANPRSIAVPSS